MLKKLLLLLLLCTACTVTDNGTRIAEIDKKIEKLRQEKYQHMLAELKIDSESQSLMMVDWEEYAKKIEEIKKVHEDDIRILKEIIALQDERIQLMDKKK